MKVKNRNRKTYSSKYHESLQSVTQEKHEKRYIDLKNSNLWSERSDKNEKTFDGFSATFRQNGSED